MSTSRAPDGKPRKTACGASAIVEGHSKRAERTTASATSRIARVARAATVCMAKAVRNHARDPSAPRTRHASTLDADTRSSSDPLPPIAACNMFLTRMLCLEWRAATSVAIAVILASSLISALWMKMLCCPADSGISLKSAFSEE